MSRNIIIASILFTVLIQCKKDNHFIIAKNKVGKLTSNTQIYELKKIFEKDSLVVHLGEGDFADASYDEYEVFSKKGNHLLTIIPKEQHDSTATIEYVRIFDKQFKTAKGLSLASSFKEVISNYEVSKVEDAINVAQISLDELNATLTIDKKELGIDDFASHKIVVEQIPDMAKIKTLTFWFD